MSRSDESLCRTESPKTNTFFKVVDIGSAAPGVQQVVPGWWHGGWHPGPVAFAMAGTLQPTLLAGEYGATQQPVAGAGQLTAPALLLHGVATAVPAWWFSYRHGRGAAVAPDTEALAAAAQRAVKR